MPYIGVSPQFGVRRKHTYTATAGQTSFSGAGSEGATLSYKDSNFVDVYQNGVKLGDADYTSTSGTAIVLAQGASVNDLVEIIVFDAFSAADTVSKADGGTFDSGVTVTDSGASPIIANRTTSDGDIIDLQKGGTSVGKIGNAATDDFYIGASTANHSGLYFGTNIVYPMTANSLSDGATSLGHSSNRFNNLYLSGGVYIGGTGSANYLDDYEEGTWTPATSTSSYNTGSSIGRYTKIGRIVIAHFGINFSAVNSGNNSNVIITGFPFTSASDIAVTGSVRESSNTGAIYATRIGGNQTIANMNSMDGTSSGNQRTIRTSEDYVGSLIYMT